MGRVVMYLQGIPYQLRLFFMLNKHRRDHCLGLSFALAPIDQTKIQNGVTHTKVLEN